ncbi:MAG: trigger factor [Lautropia sp.]
MASQLETMAGLERRLTLSVSPADIARLVDQRLKSLSRTVRMPGFRPGKVPMRMIAQSYGAQVQSEVLGDAVSKAFSDAVAEHKLRVAGQPKIELGGGAAAGDGSAPGDAGAAAAPTGDAGTDQGATDGAPAFVATFEVYPDVSLKDPAGETVERFACEVGDADLEKTIEILRKQRTRWNPIERSAADGDRLTIDFVGKLDGVAFEGGSAEGFTMILGEGRMLPDFETGLRGATPGAPVTFDVRFPDDYSAKELAGKQANFEVKVTKLEAPEVPELNEDFAREMGVENGDIGKFRADVRANLEREVAQRLKARTKNAVMDTVAKLADIELPKALTEQESQVLAERMKEDLKSRGVDVANVPVPPDAFKDRAEQRVRLGLIVAEIVKEHKLAAKPDQIRKQIEEFSQTYENPGEVIRWYYSDRNRLAEVEALVVEQNVVDWVLSKATVTETVLGFDELMKN